MTTSLSLYPHLRGLELHNLGRGLYRHHNFAFLFFSKIRHFHYIIMTYWPHPQGNEFHNAGKEMSAYHNHVL